MMHSTRRPPAFGRWISDADGRLRWHRFAVVLACGYLVFAATYLPINLFSVGRPASTLYLPGEEGLPFLPAFVYLYVLTYFVGAFLIVTVRDYYRFLRLAAATGVSLLMAYATYLLVPVYLERPHLEVNSVHTWLLSIIYLDKSYNHFPSLHVTLSWLAFHAAQVPRRARIALSVLVAALSVSTLFVKQHYVVDVVAGFALAWIAWWIGGASKRVRLPAGAATTRAPE